MGNDHVFERAIKPPNARFLETMAGSTRSGNDKIPGIHSWRVLPKFGHRYKQIPLCEMEARDTRRLLKHDNHDVWY